MVRTVQLTAKEPIDNDGKFYFADAIRGAVQVIIRGGAESRCRFNVARSKARFLFLQSFE